MKYDITKTITKGAQRTLYALSGAMFLLLEKNDFEGITVNEICTFTNYPRATFYNYFDDKYDLLNYCWYRLEQRIELDDYTGIAPEERIYVFFDRIYDLLDSEITAVQKILEKNTESGYMFNSFRIYLGRRMVEIFRGCISSNNYSIPKEIVADHYCNTLLLILKWAFRKDLSYSKTQAHKYLYYLLRS